MKESPSNTSEDSNDDEPDNDDLGLFQEEEEEDEINLLEATMADDTAATLDRPEFKLSDVKDMKALDNRDLGRWLIYAGWIVHNDSIIGGYGGCCYVRGSAYRRLINNYERAL